MDRPAIKRLLEDITTGRIDIVVVYKVDRLTRSLMDFARIVETFDSNDTSFVSVTQAFNTTNSMGRLTLNVLLSFAQFEREVTGERIRDKIAASRVRGIWMGGNLALGYDLGDRRLLINEPEAETVRHIFRRYLGEAVHKGIAHAGEHKAIVEPELFAKVQTQLGHSRHSRVTRKTRQPPARSPASCSMPMASRCGPVLVMAGARKSTGTMSARHCCPTDRLAIPATCAASAFPQSGWSALSSID